MCHRMSHAVGTSGPKSCDTCSLSGLNTTICQQYVYTRLNAVSELLSVTSLPTDVTDCHRVGAGAAAASNLDE
jgi:hypothetical protein